MSANQPIAGKLSLRSTTKISLNDRFKILRQNVVTKSGINADSSSSRVNQHRGSARNKRLALQMANRPSVQAALKIKNKSIKQRLGTSKTAARVNRGSTRFNTTPKPIQSKPSARVRLNRGNFVGTKRVALKKPRQPASVQITGRRRIGGSTRSLATQRVYNRVGVAGGSQNPRVGSRKPIGGKKRGNLQQRKPTTRQANQRQRPGTRNRQRGGKQRWQRSKPADKSQLDKDLDAYMAKTRTHLDAELDAYMAEATSN